MKSHQKFLEDVTAGRCPEVTITGENTLVVREWGEVRDELNETGSGAETGALPGVCSQSGFGAQFQTVRDKTNADTCDMIDGLAEEGHMQLSPNGRALYSLIDELDPSSLPPAHVENAPEDVENGVHSESVSKSQSVAAPKLRKEVLKTISK
ncbi:hypothetical protein PPTG_11951 [Phytophthora nicotianae INRA-310]|uniref:Uncharacterized protein n=1 Tax=Phytophthora nicotianae (strain INRA-310) TaxID=761204 RepID=W2Q8Y3_PHYN3|nr:hypothetical protein PPTG_11951 [Phytophthora nicotianae INRA-310]ETN09622.1 hypothetical protein PPTG_11951 [Phytophthora nicotianae INRA-310]